MISSTRPLVLADGTPIQLQLRYSLGTWELRPFHIQGEDSTTLGWLVATIRLLDDRLPYAELIKPANRSLFVDDFILCARGKGLGSAMLQILAEIGRTQTPVSRIEGNISAVDWDHVDRLERFYTQQGYTVELNHANQNGCIVKRLSSSF